MSIEKIKKPDGVTVTLCMIVKNETHIIKECLESMLPYIDRYDITDTGSTDGTPELIKEFMDEHGVPGEVYLSDWKGFGKSRSESLINAEGKATYAWMIDADDKITGTFIYPEVMEADAFSLRLGRPDFSWYRNQIFKLDPTRRWEYVGVLHEYAQIKDVHPQEMRIVKWEGNYFVEARTLGARNVGIDPVEKYSRDADVLKSALTNEEDPYYDPTNVRYQFYLAQSYFDSQQWEKAEEAYQKRADMGGWDEEIWFAYFRIAIIKAIMGASWPEIKEAYLEAYNFRPTRAEPLYEISRAYRSMDKPRLAYLYAKIGVEIQYPQTDILFIAQDVYEWKMLDEFSSTAFYINDFMNGFQACKILVESNRFPESEKERIVQNYKIYEQQLMQMQSQVEAQMNEQKRVEAEQKKKEKEERVNTPKKSTKTVSRKNNFKDKKKKR
tara:strand:- start:1340 stop:2659 length:1320 start_codon:yes stop_codon:yes gene_type:complete